VHEPAFPASNGTQCQCPFGRWRCSIWRRLGDEAMQIRAYAWLLDFRAQRAPNVVRHTVFMKLLRTVLATVLITIEAVFAVVILGTLVTEADITG